MIFTLMGRAFKTLIKQPFRVFALAMFAALLSYLGAVLFAGVPAVGYAIGLLLSASLAWMFAVPHLVSGDGTASGAHQVFVRYSLWGVLVLVIASLAAAGASSLSSDRDARRLQLTLVRPAARFSVAMGRIVALVSVGAAVLASCSHCPSNNP